MLDVTFDSFFSVFESNAVYAITSRTALGSSWAINDSRAAIDRKQTARISQ
jgi:hypothetical protein